MISITLSGLTRVIAASIICASITSCGESNSTTTSAPSSSSSTIEIDDTIPLATTRQIVTYTTSLDSQHLGTQSIATQPNKYNEWIVLANNNNGDIHLASIITGDTNTKQSLNATTTAIAFVRLLAGTIPQNVSASDFNSTIQSSSSFSSLVKLINEALASGTPPIDYPGTSEQIYTVITQTYNSLKTPTSSAQIRAASLESETATTPLPYRIFEDGPDGYFSVRLVETDPNSKGVKITNGFPIKFATYSSALDGTVIAPSHNEIDGYPQIILPDSGLILNKNPTTIPANGASWNLTVYQTPITRTANAIALTQSLLETSLSLSGLDGVAEKCISSALTDILTSTPIPVWAYKLSASEAWN